MTNDERAAPWSRLGAGIVAPIQRVNLALPFSTITVHEPSKEVAELSSIVAGLLTALENGSPGEAITELRQRAEALAARSGRHQ
jgi:hypothetical protein